MQKKPNYKIMKRENELKILAVCPTASHASGIYIMTRFENNIKYAYIGQAVDMLNRLASHLTGYQHIDLSIKNHGLYSELNPNGWKIGCLIIAREELDNKERHYIELYANKGYQLYNHTTGGQDSQKKGMDHQKLPTKGYLEGLSNGKKQLARELKHIQDLHVDIVLKKGKENNKVSQNALLKYQRLIDMAIGDE